MSSPELIYLLVNYLSICLFIRPYPGYNRALQSY